MARLTLLAAAFIGLASPAAAQVDRWSGEIARASERFGVPQDWVRRVMKAESDGRTTVAGVRVVSRAGAMGLMQLMPATWADMRDLYALGQDPFDPHDNIVAGTAYLRLMYDRFGYPGLFAAYNAGPKRYAGHLASGAPLPPETIGYLVKTVGAAGPARLSGGPRSPRIPPAIFAVGASATSASVRPKVSEADSGLFAIRR